MYSISRFQSHFIANWKFGVLALIGCLFFTRLGFWQLKRADEKQQLLLAHHQQSIQFPTLWQPGQLLPSQYQPIRVHGRYLPTSFLFDNQHYQHQLGYDALSPLILSDGKIILIDRGFIVGDANREILPFVDVPTGEQDVVGSVYIPSDKNWSLGNIVDRKKPGLVVIELIDPHVVGQFLHKSVYPFIIRMHPGQSHGFVRDWPVVAMSPSRHLAYAVQWFALASLVLVLWIGLNIKKRR
jgi:surfeit locus 1 family protein